MSAGDELTLTLRGLDEFNRDVDGEVFARKLFKFMQGLAAADIAANGTRRHKYLISELKKNTATASVREQVATGGVPPESSINYYEKGIIAINDDSATARQLPREFVRYVVDINKEVGESFTSGEIKRKSTGKVIQIDNFFKNNAKRVLDDINRRRSGALPFFEGAAHGAFDGVLMLLDSLGGTERAILVLTAGGKKITCNTDNVDDEELRKAWKRRCVVQGVARYSGASGLPERVDAHSIRVVAAPGGLDAWQGAFEIPDSDDDAWA